MRGDLDNRLRIAYSQGKPDWGRGGDDGGRGRGGEEDEETEEKRRG
jgi:hypothetical protein